jgi:hypothetical protein
MATQQAGSSKELERAILDRQLNGIAYESHKKGSGKNVLAYATTMERVILALSSVCAVLAGALNPLVPVCVHHPRAYVRTGLTIHRLGHLWSFGRRLQRL